MNQEKWKLEWHWDKDKDLLVIHVFPHRTFLIRTDKIYEAVIPYLAGLACFNVMLGQDNKIRAQVESKESLPKELEDLSIHLNEISQGKFFFKFDNIEDLGGLQRSNNNVLLFSGGKDSLWQLNHLKNNHDTSKLVLLYVSGTTIAGEYVQELATAKHLSQGMNLSTVSIESYDYTSIGLNFIYRPRWRSLMLICIARMFSDKIWTGISNDKRFTTGEDMVAEDNINFFSELPTTLLPLANMLKCDIWLSPPESYCYFNIDSEKYPYRSCYSPDVVCSPENDFTNSCWKCRTLHIYHKIGKGDKLTEEEEAFAESDDWPGDIEEEISKNAKRIDIYKPISIKRKR